MSNIVERLRKWSVFGYGYEASCDMKEAATAIEAQRANMANAARLLSEQTAEITRLRAIATPKPLDDSAPKDRELIGVERPPCEDRNYFSFIQWHEDKQRWMARIGYDWSVNPAPTLWAICGASHYLDPLDFSLLPEEVFEDGDDEGDTHD